MAGRLKVKNKKVRPEPGRVRLREDAIRSHALDREVVWRPRDRETPPPVQDRPQNAIPVRDVERRILRSMQTLRVLPDQEKRFHRVGNGWPNYVQEYMDAYDSVEAIVPRFKPTPFDISDYLRALAWTRHLAKNEWRILWWRSCGLSFGLIGRYTGRSDETVRRRYRDTIIDVWCAANAIPT